MSDSKSWMAEISKERYAFYLSSIWSYIRRNDRFQESPPQGIGEVIDGPHQVSYAVDDENNFAAFQWLEDTDSGWLRIESFFVCPAAERPRVGLRLAASLQHESIDIPDWWVKIAGDSGGIESRRVPGFMQLSSKLAASGNISTTNGYLAEQIAELTHELKYFRQLADDQQSELREMRLRAKDSWLFVAPSQGAESDGEIPKSGADIDIIDLSGLGKWADENQDRIVILPRALYGAKKSRYESPGTVYAALELLAGSYRELRSGRIEKSIFESELSESGLQLRGSIKPSTAGSEGHAYFVAHEGRKCSLDWHLAKGGGRDERYCMRIYFFWDDNLGKVVVGWLPSHLNNSLT